MSQLVRTAPGSAPLTPAGQTSAPSTPSGQKVQVQQATPSGTWKHPKFDEITRRQYATTFDERNVRIILANSTLLLLAFVSRGVASKVPLLNALVVYVFSLLNGSWTGLTHFTANHCPRYCTRCHIASGSSTPSSSF
jgi:nucleoporin POM34